MSKRPRSRGSANLATRRQTDLKAARTAVAPERAAYADVVLGKRLQAAIARLNPALAPDRREEVFRKIIQAEFPGLVEENRRLQRYLVEGVPIEITRDRRLASPASWRG